jgi:poly(3-hydroxybutyrate) depolymerase
VRAALALIFVLVGAAARADAPVRRALDVGGVERVWWQLDAGPRPGPVLVALAGALGDARAFADAIGLWRLARTAGLIAVAPEQQDGHWNDGRRVVFIGTPSTADDLTFLETLTARLVAEGVARADAIHVTGFSNGGLMALALAGRATLAGVAPVAATLPAEAPATCHPRGQPGLTLVVGAIDPLFPPAGGTVTFAGRKAQPRLSAAASAALWGERVGCAGAGSTRSEGPMAVTVLAGCPRAARVASVEIAGLGHLWPDVAPVDVPRPFAGWLWSMLTR